jgi:hypothetical protein
MASIDELIQREINPFDKVNLKPGNFWHTLSQSTAVVNSIHQPALNQIEGCLNLVAQDHQSRSLMLIGDSGSGKSFLLDRLKRQFNDKAFFAYIGPWADGNHIWRHVLRYTVDSLMQVPIGQTESQLMQWLKGLSAFTQRSLKQRIFDDSVWGILQNDRRKFINHLKKTYKTANIYSPDIFFGVLHDLTDPELYPLACEWLRGDDLSEESIAQLRVKRCVDSEDDAKTILANISRIATETLPIVLCFDQLDNTPEQDGVQDFQPLFNINTLIHNDGLHNFLVIISIITDTWRLHSDRIRTTDRARFEDKIQLRQINLAQAEALWVEQLKELHHAAKPKPESPIFPLERSRLEAKFPGGKTKPRNVIVLGRETYQHYKLDLFQQQQITATKTASAKAGQSTANKSATSKHSTDKFTTHQSISKQVILKLKKDQPTESQLQAEFKLEWEREYKKISVKILKLTSRSAPELIQMIQETLTALGVSGIKLKLLNGKYASYSLQYKHPKTQAATGLVWTEDASMQSFYYVMSACQKAVGQSYDVLQLIRAGGVGGTKTKANEIYRQLFEYTDHRHIKPKLTDIQLLATYHSLVNAAAAHELVLAGQSVTLPRLMELVRETQVLQACQLLQAIGVVSQKVSLDPPPDQIQEHLMNLMIMQKIMGVSALISNTLQQFPDQSHSKINQAIAQLCQTQKLCIINPKQAPAKQMICWQPD